MANTGLPQGHRFEPKKFSRISFRLFGEHVRRVKSLYNFSDPVDSWFNFECAAGRGLSNCSGSLDSWVEFFSRIPGRMSDCVKLSAFLLDYISTTENVPISAIPLSAIFSSVEEAIRRAGRTEVGGGVFAVAGPSWGEILAEFETKLLERYSVDVERDFGKFSVEVGAA